MQPELCGAFSFMCPTDAALIEKYNELFELALTLERLTIKLNKEAVKYQDFVTPLVNQGLLTIE